MRERSDVGGGRPPLSFAKRLLLARLWSRLRLGHHFLVGAWLAAAAGVPGTLWGADWQGQADLVGQVRDGVTSSRTESPVNFYGALSAQRLPHDVGGETYFRLERDWAQAGTNSDFYLGQAQLGIHGLQFSLGRQMLDEVAAGFFVADAGRLSFDRGRAWAISIFGGQPRYFEPPARSTVLSRDEQFVGASARYRFGPRSSLALSFVQLQRDGHRVRQLTQFQFHHRFPSIGGRPDLYTLASYDSAEQNLERMSAGMGWIWTSRLFARTEVSYYKPEQRSPAVLFGLSRYADPIFSLFSVSSLRQARAGLQYFLRRNVSAYADYSALQYEPVVGERTTGHVATIGLLWHPGGDGFETVRAEYSVIDSLGGNVWHGRLYYENQVYRRILFRITFAVASFDKITRQSAVAASGRVGVGYLVRPGWLAEVSVEGNGNPRFEQEFRLGAFFTYRWRYGPLDGWRGMDAIGRHLPGGWAG